MNGHDAMSSFSPSTLVGKRVAAPFPTDAVTTLLRLLRLARAIGTHAGPIALGLLIALAANLFPAI